MSVTSIPFGTALDGRTAHLYLLSNAGGMTVGVSDLGACLVSCRVPDGRGNAPDVLLGFDNASRYSDNIMAFGGIVGRVANRIAGASFGLHGTRYELTANQAGNCLHGGRDMWFERMWAARADSRTGSSSVVFSLFSPAGDQGFPADLAVEVTYELLDDNSLAIGYHAQASEPTPVNLCCHPYWNLNGHASGDVLGHTLQVEADSYTVVDSELIPTGEVAPVAGTPLDLREPRRIGDCLDSGVEGIDNNFALRPARDAEPFCGLPLAATLTGDVTGIRLRVYTTAPGLQVYTAAGLDERRGKDGARYGSSAGVALETQLWPDAIHHPEFPAATDPVFGPDRPFSSRTVFRFDQTPSAPRA